MNFLHDFLNFFVHYIGDCRRGQPGYNIGRYGLCGLCIIVRHTVRGGSAVRCELYIGMAHQIKLVVYNRRFAAQQYQTIPIIHAVDLIRAAKVAGGKLIAVTAGTAAATPLAPVGTLRMDASVPERAEYEQQIEVLQDGKRTLYERYLMGEVDLSTYKEEKVACDELLLKTKNAYAAVLAQAKQKQDEQARQDSRKEASKAIFDADTLTTELSELLIDRVLVYPDKRIEIAYKIRDIFD